MGEAQKTYSELFKLASSHVKTSTAWQKALPWLAGGGLLAAGVGAPLAYRAGRRKSEEEESERRPWLFGAGALSGLVAPHVLKQLKSAVGMGLAPGAEHGFTDEFTEF